MHPCPTGVPSGTDPAVERFQERILSDRVPIEGSFAVTRRCNLDCVHCYLGGEGHSAGDGAPELDGSEIAGILDQLVAAGTLSLTLTGGEPVLREDFGDIYARAVSRGLLVTVFSNGTAFDGRVLRLWRELPPRNVEITLHATDRDVYESVTRVSGSFDACMEGIRLLRENRVRFSLKTVALTLNAAGLDGVEDLARQLGVPFKYDTALFPPLAGEVPGTPPLAELRVPPEDIPPLDTASRKRLETWADVWRRDGGKTYPHLTWLCGAGQTNFHIEPDGFLTPCVLASSPRWDLRRGAFLEGWNGPLAEIRRLVPRDGFACTTCTIRSLCAGCPTLFELEEGAPDRISGYLCRTAHERFSSLAARGILTT
jgi:radical SAM protein with 4Fe4S-binding SPASM domain